MKRGAKRPATSWGMPQLRCPAVQQEGEQPNRHRSTRHTEEEEEEEEEEDEQICLESLDLRRWWFVWGWRACWPLLYGSNHELLGGVFRVRLVPFGVHGVTACK